MRMHTGCLGTRTSSRAPPFRPVRWAGTLNRLRPAFPSSHSSYRVASLTTLVFVDALHRLEMVDESAIDAPAIGFFGGAAAVPRVPAAQRGAAAQGRGASLPRACRMRSEARVGSGAAEAGRAVGARLAAWPLDIGRMTLLASLRDRHTSARSALCTLGLVCTSPSRRVHGGPCQTGSNVVVTGGNGSIYIYYAYAQTGSEALPTIGNRWAATAAQLDMLRDRAKQRV